ncbi:MAG TPA: MFS transporter [Trebonia sp.]|nr:MFS transporter [Trebonia sp.]
MRIRRLEKRSLGRQFGWLWAAYAVSACGSGIGFGAFPLIAVLVLHSGPVEVSALSAAGLAAGAVVAVPLGPWVEYRRKRPVMMAMDLTRFLALMTIPAAYALGCLSFAQLLVVSVIVAAAKIAFNAASGANLKAVVQPEDLLVANSRFQSTSWAALMAGPPLGGAAVGLIGPVTTVIADAVSYLLSAFGIAAAGGREPHPSLPGASRPQVSELLEGWRYILGSPALRPVFFNSLLAGGLILATEPQLAVLMLRQLKFAPWQYTLAFGAPCIGGLIGSWLAGRLVDRFGRHRVMLVFGTMSACWPTGLAFTGPGTDGLILVISLQFALVLCMGVYVPVSAAYRLGHTEKRLVARVLAAWSVSKNLSIAALTAVWGVLASLTSPRIAIAAAGILLLGTPLLLPRREHVPQPEPAGQPRVSMAG